jgi:hypothetical protein
MFQALRGPLTVGGRLLLSTIFYCECPQLLAIRLALDLADLFVRGESHGVKQEPNCSIRSSVV